jgi:4-amino-4-deoxy-L-arabinose transferase-like glycosyltransferase
MLLPLAIALYFVIARRVLSPPLALAYPLLVALLLYRNMYADLTFRLLSENLVMPLIPLAILAFVSARERDSVARYALAGALTGIVALTRQNLEFAIPLLAIVAFVYGRGDRRRRIVSACTLVAGGIAGLAPLAIRNGLVTGHYTISSPRQWKLVPRAVWFRDYFGLLMRTFFERALYCLGILSPRLTRGIAWTINKQFLLASVAALAQLAPVVRTRRLAFLDAVCAAWLLAAYAPFIALPALGGYGMRFQWPTAPLVVLLACRFVDGYVAARVMQPRLVSSPRP